VLSTPNRVRISEGVARQLLVKRESPEYPLLARNNHVQGDVVIRFAISTTGDVLETTALDGDPFLVPSAIKAVKRWRFKPYLLNGHS
jgi:protein TonB